MPITPMGNAFRSIPAEYAASAAFADALRAG